jgi:prevent-host-death family protein
MTKHWALQDAKARLSELVRAAEKEPQIITYHGEPKVEVRAIKSKKAKKPMTLLEALRSAPPGFAELELPPRKRERPRKTFADIWKAAPRVPEFELPPRKRERPRKVEL